MKKICEKCILIPLFTRLFRLHEEREKLWHQREFGLNKWISHFSFRTFPSHALHIIITDTKEGRWAGIAQSVQRLATGWAAEGSEFESRKGQDFFLFSTSCKLVLGPIQPPVQWVLEVNRPEPEADHSSPNIAEVKNGGAMPLLPYTSS
jgi:hypothetical protein